MSGLIALDNGHLRIELDPEHGAEILSVTNPGVPAGAAGSGNALAHHDWAAPARARDGQRYGTSAMDWLSNYRGGWQECFPNSGAESQGAGVVTPFHGEVSTTSWRVVQASPDEVELAVPTRQPLVLTRRMRLVPDAAVLLIEEEVENVGTGEVDFVWGHHPVFPAIAGTRVDLPACQVQVEPANHDGVSLAGGTWPHIPGPAGTVDLSMVGDDKAHRLTYQHQLSDGWVALRPPSGSPNPGVALAWDLQTWPVLWMWLLAGTEEFPWFGRARMLGLEPNRAWPFDGLDGARSRGQQLRLAAGATYRTWVTMRLLHDDTAVTGMSRDGTLDHLA